MNAAGVKIAAKVVEMMLSELSTAMNKLGEVSLLDLSNARAHDQIFTQFVRFSESIRVVNDDDGFSASIWTKVLVLTPWGQDIIDWSEHMLRIDELGRDQIYYQFVSEQIKAFVHSEGLFWQIFTLATEFYLDIPYTFGPDQD